MLIRIGISGENFACHATYSDAREADHLAAPIDGELFSRLDRAFESQNSALEMGRALHQWLFGTAQSPTALRNGAGSERIYLIFGGEGQPNSPELSKLESLPWELLFNDTGGFIARDPKRGVFRIGKPPARGPLGASLPEPVWPLRIVAASGYHDNSVDFGHAEIADQIEALREVFVPLGRSVSIEIIETITNTQLEKAIQGDYPTILHFSGHARHLAGTPASLVTVDQSGKSAEFSIARIGDLLIPPINLVVLSACKSAALNGQAAEAIWQQSLAQMFLAIGTKAVIAMQADVQGKVATLFMRRFYEVCLAGKSIEEAVSEGRRAIAPENPSWAIPTLTLAGVPGHAGYQIFDRSRVVKKIVPFGAKDEHSPRFTADFHAQRRALHHWVAGTDLGEQIKGPLALLTGDANSGKTHFMRWALSNVAHLGHRIRYIEFTSFKPEQQSLVYLLRAVRDGSPARNVDGSIACDPKLKVPLGPDDAFSAFNADLNALLAGGGPPPAPTAGAVVMDEFREAAAATLAPVGGRPFNEHIADRFLAALRQSAEQTPLFIAIDIGSVPGNFAVTEFAPFLEHVVIPEIKRSRAAGGDLPPVRFAFCCRGDAAAGLLEPLFRWYRDEIDLNMRPPEVAFKSKPTKEELSRYFYEMYWFKQREGIDKTSQLVFAVSSEPFDMGLCSTFTGIVKAAGFLEKLTNEVGEMQ